MSQTDPMYSALVRIAEVVKAAVNGDGDIDDFGQPEGRGVAQKVGREPEQAPSEETCGCLIKSLPSRLLVKAAEVARTINPVNAPVFGPLAAVAGNGAGISEPLRLAVVTSKYWGPAPRRLTVSFTEATSADLKARIISHMNAWTKTACVSFVATNETGDVRISRGPGGYWSYLGTDIKLIPKNRPTMNLQGFTMNTPESEYKRVVRHETGHTLGFPHEHMRKDLVARLDPEKAYRWFWDTYGWDKATVDAQVLTPLDEKTLMGTPVDQVSIMCYQLPGTITKNGKAIPGGLDINPTDFKFAGKIYPKPKPKPGHTAAVQEDDWTEAEDVDAAELETAH